MIVDGRSMTNYTYDANGNTLKKVAQLGSRKFTLSYGYDNKNQLVKVTNNSGNTIEYTYDANGNRFKKTVTTSGSAAVSRYYSYDASGNIVSEYTKENNYSLKIAGDTTSLKRVKQHLNVSGVAGESLALSAFNKTIGTSSTGGAIGVVVYPNYTDGTKIPFVMS